jgi:hypothetical protein
VALKIANGSNLYDEYNGRLVGFITQFGEEQLLSDLVSGVTLEQFNDLNAIVLEQGDDIEGLDVDLAALTGIVNGHTTAITGLIATDVSLQAQITALGSGGSDAISGITGDNIVDNTTTVRAALGPAGSYYTAGKTRAEFGTGGAYRMSLVDLHPSVSLEMDGRGGKLLVPKDNLPALTSNYDGVTDTSVGHVYGGGAYGAGAEAAVIRGWRATSPSALNLAWQLSIGGFNIDFRGTTQTNGTHALRWPNPDNTENLDDGDPLYLGNKDYTAPHIHDCDFIGGPGTGVLIEAGNGRFCGESARMLNFGGPGWDLGGNDIVMYGHWAAGGCGGGTAGGFGIKVGNAAGFLAVTGNMWGTPGNRSWKTGAMFINDRRSFAVGYCVINDLVRFDGDSNWDQGGVFACNTYATHDENFSDECVAINVLADGDLRAQCNNAVASYRALSFIGNAYYKSTKVAFDTWQNVGGALDGKGGTAYMSIYDASANAAINCIDTINSDPNCKPWGAVAQAFTVSGATTTQITCTAHGLRNFNRIAFKPGSLPTGLVAGVTWWVTVVDADHFKVSVTPNGSFLSITGNGSGTFANLSTLPYGTRGDSTVNFQLMDVGTATTRFGAVGNGNPGRVVLATANGDEGAWTDLTGTFTFTYGGSSSVYTINAVAHSLRENQQVRLTTTGTLPGGLSTTRQYTVRNANADDFQLADTPGGSLVTVTSGAGSGVHTFNAWNFTYGTEIGDKTRHGGLAQRHALWGQQEFDCAPTAMPGSWSRYSGAGAVVNGDTKNVSAGAPYAFFGGASIAGFTVNLPTGMTASYQVRLFFNITATAITWTGGALNSGSAPLPKTVEGWGVLVLEWLADSQEWNVVSWNTTTVPYVALGTSGTLTADLTVSRNFLVGPCTGNTTIANPTGSTVRDGQTYCFLVKQDGTGGRNISLGAKFIKNGGDTFGQAANSVTMFKATYNAVDDKYYIDDFKVVSGNAWTTLTGTSGTIATDASRGKTFFVGAITGNTTIGNPTNPADGVDYTWHVLQNGTGGWTIGLDTKFAKSALTFVPDTTASTATIFTARYSAANDKFYVTQFQTKVS